MSFIAMRSSLLAIILTLATVIVMVAQTAPAEAAESTSTEVGKHAVLPPPQVDDDMEGESELPWLFAVFFVTWAAFFGYVFVMSRRQREMRREIDALRGVLARRERDEGEAGEEDRG